MARNEEISEKIADLLFDQIPRTADYVLKQGEELVKGADEFATRTTTQLLDEAVKAKSSDRLQQLSGEVTMPQMNEILKTLGVKSRTLFVADSDLEDFEKLLQERHILYAKYNVADDDGHGFVYLDRDVEEVDQVTQLLKAQRGTAAEVTPKMYIDHLAPEFVETLDGLDDVEIALFRHYARQRGLLFTVIDREDNTHMVVYGAEDADKARRAMLHTGWDLTGANGALYRKQVEYMLEGHNKIHYSAEEAATELYIVSRDRPGNYIHITEEDYTLYKAGQPVSQVSRMQKNFAERCIQDCRALTGAVVLTPEQYSPDISYEDLLDYPTISLHVSEYEEEVEASRLSGLISLVDKKETYGDPAVYGLETPEVTYDDYSDLEYIMDDEEREARGFEFIHFREAAYYSTKRHTRSTTKLELRSVDYLISRAEERRGAASQPVPERGKSGPAMGGNGPAEPFL